MLNANTVNMLFVTLTAQWWMVEYISKLLANTIHSFVNNQQCVHTIYKADLCMILKMVICRCGNSYLIGPLSVIWLLYEHDMTHFNRISLHIGEFTLISYSVNWYVRKSRMNGVVDISELISGDYISFHWLHFRVGNIVGT